MRSLKSVPPSFKLAEKYKANYRPLLGCLEHAADDEDANQAQAEPEWRKAEGEAAAALARRRPAWALPVHFALAEDESPSMFKLRTAGYDDDTDDGTHAAGVCRDVSPSISKLRTAGYDDDDAHPAARQLRALSASFVTSSGPDGPP